MGVILLVVAVVLMFHSGVCWERQKTVEITRTGLRVTAAIDPVAGSGSTLNAAIQCGREAYGFEIKKDFYKDALQVLEAKKVEIEEIHRFGFSSTRIGKGQPTLFNFINKEVPHDQASTI